VSGQAASEKEEGREMKGYDEKCGELAKYFLPDSNSEATALLAQHIQDSIEDWLASNEKGIEQEQLKDLNIPRTKGNWEP